MIRHGDLRKRHKYLLYNVLNLVVSKHVIEGVAELISNLLALQLLPVDLVLNVVNPVVKLSNVHLAILIAGLSLLQPVKKLVDLVLQLLLTLGGLLGRDLKLLHVLANGLKLLLNILKFALGQLSPVGGPLTLVLLDAQLPGKLIELLLIVACHFGCLPEVFVSLLQLDLAVHGLVLKVLDLLQDAVSFLGCKSQLGDSFGKG